MVYLVGVALVSVSLMALEIGLTRIFSCMIWYHLSFLTISLTMLGFSLGGLLLLFFPALKNPDEKRTVPLCAALFALSVTFGIIYINFMPQALWILQAKLAMSLIGSRMLYFVFLLMIFLTAFLFAGLTISTAITQKADKIGRVYFANMLGSAVGCVGVIFLLSQFAAFKSMLFIVALAALVPFFFGGLRQASRIVHGLNIIVLVASIVAIGFLANDRIFARSLLTRLDVTDENRIYREWNSFSVVDFYRPHNKKGYHYYEGLWGLSSAYKGKRPEPIKIIIDSWAITSINKVEEDTLDLELYGYLPSNLAYRLKRNPDVLIIGAGGGIDVLASLHYDARSVHAIEINPSIVKAVQHRFDDYAGHIYNNPKVKVTIGEGRHVISRESGAYDMIQLSGVDTLSGAQSSSYSFSESYLYTLEAFEKFMDHLNPDGVITFMRFAFEKPREMLRLMTSAAEALRRRGIMDPSKHMVVVHSNQHVFATMMLKKNPFTPQEMALLEGAVRQNEFRFLYHPHNFVGGEYDKFLAANDWEAFYKDYPYRISPVSDDAPFFFNYTKLGDLLRLPDSDVYWLYWLGQTILFYGAALVLLLSLLFIGWPLLRFRLKQVEISGKYRFIVYFLCLGLAFMFVEIILMQRFTLFLGQPIYSLTLILFCMLVFAGVGSYFSKRLVGQNRSTLIRCFILLFGALVVTYLLTEWVFDSLLHAPLWVRAVLSVLLLAPPSFLMGIPFPLGVRVANAFSPQMVPWGWAINGYGSVVGAFISVILGLIFGFAVVYGIAICLYALAAVTILTFHHQPA